MEQSHLMPIACLEGVYYFVDVSAYEIRELGRPENVRKFQYLNYTEVKALHQSLDDYVIAIYDVMEALEMFLGDEPITSTVTKEEKHVGSWNTLNKGASDQRDQS